MSKVVKVYYGQHMGMSFKGMAAALGKPLDAGEAAVFVNAAWTAAKVLYPDDHIHYHRLKGRLTVNDLVALPTRLPTTKLALGSAGMAQALKEHGRFLRELRARKEA